MPLNVVIIGAGIGGLCAAIGFRRAGHSVKVIEKSRFASEVGAAVALSPNGSSVLSSMGFSFERAKACVQFTWESVDGTNLDRLTSQDFSDLSDKYGWPFMSVHRVDLHKELLRLAVEGEDNPATLILSIAAKNVDLVTGVVELSDGTSVQADLIVGADGVHSMVRGHVLGPSELSTPSMTDMSAFRCLIPTAKLQADDRLASLLQWKTPGVSVIVDLTDKTHERHLVWYECSGGDVQNVVGIHPSRTDLGETDHRAALLDEFSHFHPDLLQLLKLAEEVKCWPIAYYEPFPTWSRQNAVLIGDAAHPMLPFGGQGANQAIEDGGALGIVFRGADSVAEVQNRLKMFSDIKLRRTAMIQVLSSARIGREKTVEDKLWQYREPHSDEVPTTLMERNHYAFSFNVLEKCEEALRSVCN